MKFSFIVPALLAFALLITPSIRSANATETNIVDSILAFGPGNKVVIVTSSSNVNTFQVIFYDNDGHVETSCVTESLENAFVEIGRKLLTDREVKKSDLSESAWREQISYCQMNLHPAPQDVVGVSRLEFETIKANLAPGRHMRIAFRRDIRGHINVWIKLLKEDGQLARLAITSDSLANAMRIIFQQI